MPSTASFLFPDIHSLWSDYDPSEGRRPYRYFLRRLENKVTGLIEPDKPPMVFVLLNPSTADEIKDDPTVAKSRRHAAGWGYGEVIILNAFAYRATDPRNMKAQPDPIGPKNDQSSRRPVQRWSTWGGVLFAAGAIMASIWAAVNPAGFALAV